MNNALLSSKNMCWCTPPDFFAELDREFHFELDPASTDKSAKCAKHFTPDDDGLKQDWGGVSRVLQSVIRPRLTELKGAGVLEVVGKKPSKRTGKNTAVWAAVRR